MDPDRLEKFMRKDHARISGFHGASYTKKSIMSSLMDNRGCHRTHPSHDYHTAVPVRQYTTCDSIPPTDHRPCHNVPAISKDEKSKTKKENERNRRQAERVNTCL